MTSKIPVGILGATGTVGQRFIQLLHEHPWFEITWLAASDRSAGKLYPEAAKWNLATPIPARIAAMKVSAAAPDSNTPRLVFAALDATAAQQIEPAFAEAGHAVVSNSSAFRMAEDVPLIIPEVNGDHVPLIKAQPLGWCWRWRRCTAVSASIRFSSPLCRPSAVRAIPVSRPWTSWAM